MQTLNKSISELITQANEPYNSYNNYNVTENITEHYAQSKNHLSITSVNQALKLIHKLNISKIDLFLVDDFDLTDEHVTDTNTQADMFYFYDCKGELVTVSIDNDVTFHSEDIYHILKNNSFEQ